MGFFDIFTGGSRFRDAARRNDRANARVRRSNEGNSDYLSNLDRSFRETDDLSDSKTFEQRASEALDYFKDNYAGKGSDSGNRLGVARGDIFSNRDRFTENAASRNRSYGSAFQEAYSRGNLDLARELKQGSFLTNLRNKSNKYKQNSKSSLQLKRAVLSSSITSDFSPSSGFSSQPRRK